MNLETVEDETGPRNEETCFVCGESNFYSEGGFFYCSLCNTQSQSARQYVEENFNPEATTHTRAAVLRKEKQKGGTGKKKDRTENLLSGWEIWNIVLKYMADRLVEIGFPDTVHSKIFNFYVAFLMKRKVIFVSKVDPNARSTVTIGEPKTNLYALYGKHGVKPPSRPRGSQLRRNQAQNIRAKYRPKKRKVVDKRTERASDEEIDEHDPTRFLSRAQKKHKVTMTKRKAMEQEYMTTVPDASQADTAFEELLNKRLQAANAAPTEEPSQDEPKSQKLFVYSKATLKLGRSGLLKAGGTLKSKLLVTKKRNLPNVRLGQRLVRFEHFTFKTCLILVFVALRQLGFPVLLSDILRLYSVGILNLTITEVVGLAKKMKDYKNVKTNNNFFNSSFNFGIFRMARDTRQFIDYLGVNKFRFPQFKEITAKYTDEFVLPREFECLINLINHAIPADTLIYDLSIKGNPERYWRYKIVPEVLVLAQIMVVLKMLFGLDDRTERYQSEFAKLVNQVMKEEFKEVKEWNELFVIEDWFGYLLRRRELVKKEISNSGLFFPNSPSSLMKLTELLGNKCTISEEDDETRPSDSDNAVTEATKISQEMLKRIVDDSSPDIPTAKPYVPLPLPTQSIVEQYLERYPSVADPSFKPELLKPDFTQKRMDFVWNPKKYAKFLEIRGYEVKIIQGDAINNFPLEMEEDFDKSKVIVMFQPYKSFDDFVGTIRTECSSSMKLLLGLCEDIVPVDNAEHLSHKHEYLEMQRLVNILGNTYIKKILSEQLPVLMRWDEPWSDSE